MAGTCGEEGPGFLIVEVGWGIVEGSGGIVKG